MIRKGMTYKFTNSDVVLMPEDLFKVAQKYLYVFPRAHSVEDMLLKAKLAYYMKQDSRIYSRVVFKKK